jgi:hypothetical protein
MLCILIPAASAQTTTVSIEDVTAAPEENITVPIMVNNVTNLSGCDINITFDPSVAHLTTVTPGNMTLLKYLINNGTGWMHVNTINVSGLSENVTIAYVNLTAVGGDGNISPLNITVDQLLDVNFDLINHTVINGTFTIEKTPDTTPPMVTDAFASRDTILSDNGRARAAGSNVTVINVTVTDDDDDGGVSGVTIDLSSIGGSAIQPMDHITGTDIWTVATNATSGINMTHQLTINATDNTGNCNDIVKITLTVLRRGDIYRDNVVDMEDVMCISGYITGTESDLPSTLVLVGDVVGASGDPEGDGKVDLMDALYIARYEAGMGGAP